MLIAHRPVLHIFHHFDGADNKRLRDAMNECAYALERRATKKPFIIGPPRGEAGFSGDFFVAPPHSAKFCTVSSSLREIPPKNRLSK